MKKWCIWCQMGSMPKDGYVWIHEECFEKMHSIGSNIEMVEKYMKCEMPRIKSNGDRQGYESIEKFLVAMDDFNRRSRNIMKLIKSVRQGTPLEPLEQGTLSTSRINNKRA